MRVPLGAVVRIQFLIFSMATLDVFEVLLTDVEYEVRPTGRSYTLVRLNNAGMLGLQIPVICNDADKLKIWQRVSGEQVNRDGGIYVIVDSEDGRRRPVIPLVRGDFIAQDEAGVMRYMQNTDGGAVENVDSGRILGVGYMLYVVCTPVSSDTWHRLTFTYHLAVRQSPWTASTTGRALS
jgi:hypothetical protein